MRRAVLLGVIVVSGGCQSLHNAPGAARPRVGVLVQGVTSACPPVAIGSTVRRVCLPPPDEVPDSAKGDSLAVGR
jgi:hypothetical protein